MINSLVRLLLEWTINKRVYVYVYTACVHTFSAQAVSVPRKQTRSRSRRFERSTKTLEAGGEKKFYGPMRIPPEEVFGQRKS